MNSERTFRVFKIDNGTVIDHILSPMALKIIDILGIKNQGGIISIGMNFPSRLTGRKDIIKIENIYLHKNHSDIIALLAPNATINIIKDGKVVEKRRLGLPETVESLIKCPNPKCVTNNYHDCSTKFSIMDSKDKTTVVKCFYCERETTVFPEMFV